MEKARISGHQPFVLMVMFELASTLLVPRKFIMVTK